MRTAKPIHRLAVAAGLFIAVLVACGREITGPVSAPASLFQRIAAFAFEPRYEIAVPASALRAALTQVAFERVRITLRREDGSIALDTVVLFPVGADSLTLTLNVPLPPTAPMSGVPLNLNLGYVNAAGDTVFRGGPVRVMVVPTVSGGTTPPTTAPVQIPVQYTGTGASATAVVISPRVVNGTAGQTTTFTAQALGSGGVVIPGTPVVFTSSNTTVVTVNEISGAAAFIGRGTAKVYALLLTGPKDSATVSVTLPAARLQLGDGGNQSATVGTMLPTVITARVLATDGVGVGGTTVTFVATDGGTVTPTSAVSDASGNVSAQWKLGPVAGPQTLTLTAAGLTGSPLTVSATALAITPTKLTIQTGPVSGKAAVALAAITVAAQDANGTTATTFTGDVTVAIGANPGGATLTGTTRVKAVNGVATFSDLALDRPAAAYTLAFSSAGLVPATSAAFNITAGDAAKLVFGPVQGTVDAGVVITPPVTVSAQDAAGNPVTAFTGAVTITLGANPGGATLGGTLTRNAVAGIATFDNLTVRKSGSGYTLTAAAAGLPSATSTGFTVQPGAPAVIALVSGGGQTGVVGSVLAPITLQVRDALGNGIRGLTPALAVTTGGGSASVSASSPKTDASGNIAFTWTLGGTVGTQSVTASLPSPALSTVITATATPGPAKKLAITSAPATTQTAGVAITPTVVVQGQDSSGVLQTAFAGTVTASVASGPSGATIGGTASVTAMAGVASFSALRLTKAGTYTLTFASSGVTSATTASFTVIAAPAKNIAADSGNSQTGSAGAALPTKLVVVVTDSVGNRIPGAPLSWAVTAGGGSLSGASATTDTSGRGRATLTLGAASGSNAVQVTSAGLVGSPVTFTATATAGAATQLVITQQPPASSAAGASFTPALTVAAKDTAGNLVTSFTSAIAVAIGTNPAGGTLGGTASVSAVGGIATFSGLSINKVGTGYTLAFSSSGLTGATTSAFNITPAVASLIAADSGGATQTGPAGQRLPTQLVVKVTDALGNKVSGATVTWAVVTGGGSLDSMTTVTDTGGRARAQWTLGAADSVQTVTATSGTLTGSPVTFSAIVTSVAYLSVVSNGLWSDSNTWSPLGHPTAFDDVTIGGVGSVRLDTLAAVAIRHLTFGPGSISLRGGSLQVRGDVTGTGGGLNGGTLTIIGGTHSLTLDYATNLFIGGGGVVSLGSFLTASGDVTVSGTGSELVLNGNELDVNGFFATAAGGTVSLTSASDRLWVYAGATFGGGSTAGKLTNGFLTVVGDFTQSGAPDSFAPDSAFFTFIGEPYPEDLLPLRSSRIRTARAPGIAKLRALDVETARSARAQRSAISRAARAEQLAQFDRIRAAAFARRGLVAPSRLQAAQGGGTERAVLRQGRRTRNYSYTGTSIITFANPTTSFFGALSLAGTSYMLGSDVTVAEWLEDYSGVWQGMVSSDATPRTITSHGADVGKLRFDNVRWILLDGNAVWAMDYVEFDNMDPTVDQFTVARTSDERDACECNPYYELWYWSFFTTPTTGNYIKATDTNGEPNVVELYMTDTYPGVHGGHIAKAGGAMITSWLHSGVFVSNSDSDDISHFNGQYSSTDTATTIGGCDEPRNPAVSPNGKLFAVPCRFSGKVAFFDPVTSNFVSAVSDTSFHEPYAVAFSGDGTELWVSNKNSSTVSIVNVASGLVVAVVSPPLLNSPEGITIAAGKAFVASRGNGKVIIIDVATRAVLNSVVVGGYPRDAAGTPDGQWVYVTTDAGSVAKVKVSDGTVTQLTITGSSRNITISPDGLKIYVATENSAVAVIVVATDAVSQITFSGASNTYGVAILKDGSMGFATDSDLDKVFAFNPATGLEVTDYPFPFYVGYGPRGIVAY